MSRLSNYRHEFKYQCSDAQLAIIKHRLDAVIKLDKHASQDGYCIRSMYFDSMDLRCYNENESGTDPREKYRIRIYNANSDRISLECKRKERGKTYKTSCLITREQFDDIINRKFSIDIKDQHPVFRKFYCLLRTEHFTPSVIVEYDRVPYVCPLGNVRITLDKTIRSSDCFDQFFSQSLPCRPIMPVGQHLLEVKYDEYIPDFIKQIIQLDNLRQTTFSKYYLCKKYSMRGLLL